MLNRGEEILDGREERRDVNDDDVLDTHTTLFSTCSLQKLHFGSTRSLSTMIPLVETNNNRGR
jgi:hypothetical protein